MLRGFIVRLEPMIFSLVKKAHGQNNNPLLAVLKNALRDTFAPIKKRLLAQEIITHLLLATLNVFNVHVDLSLE